MLLVTLFTATAFAQDGIVRGRDHSVAVSNAFDDLIPARDGGYVAYGDIGDGSGTKLIAVRYDAQLNVVWEKSGTKSLRKMEETPDGGLVAVTDGYRSLHPVGSELQVIKFDRNLNVVWIKDFGGNGAETPGTVIVRPNGQLIIFGNTASTDGDVVGKTNTQTDLWMLQLDASGNLLSQKVFEHAYQSSSITAANTTDGGLVFTISTSALPGSMASNDVWVVKMDATFNIQWQKNIAGSNNEAASCILPLSDGGYAVGGITWSTDGQFAGAGGSQYGEGFVSRLDAGGNIQWTRIVVRSNTSQVNNVIELPGGVLMASASGNLIEARDITLGFGHQYVEGILVKYDVNGNTLLKRAIGAECNETVKDVVLMPNGNFLTCGMRMYCSEGGDYVNISKTPVGGETKAVVLEVRDLSTITGKVWFDTNNNKILDAGEELLKSGSVRTTKGAIGFDADLTFAEQYITSTDTGTYVTQLAQLNAYIPFLLDTVAFARSPKKKYTTFTGPGQVDAFDIRIVAADQVSDMELSLRPLADVFANNSVKFRLWYRNVGGKTATGNTLKLAIDSRYTLQSSTRPLTLVNDTLQLPLSAFIARAQDSVDVVLVPKSPAVVAGDSLRFGAVIAPLEADFDPLDNVANWQVAAKKQSDAVKGLDLQIRTNVEARLTRTVPYTLTYKFISLLDSTRCRVVVVKDEKTSLAAATPAPTRINGDSLIWEITSRRMNTGDSIRLNMQVADAPVAAMGDSLQFQTRLQVFTQDSTITVTGRFAQRIVGNYVAPDMTTTTLHPPQGVVWKRTVGGPLGDFASDVVALPDNNFITVGSEGLAGGGPLQAVITRYDDDGHVIWTKGLGGESEESLSTVRKLNDSIFWACGVARRPHAPGNPVEDEILVVKFNARGDVLLKKYYGGSLTDYAHGIAPTADGGFIINATTRSNDGDIAGYVKPDFYYMNMWVAKMDASGVIEWSKCFNHPAREAEYIGTDIRTSADGGYYLGGYATYGPYFDPNASSGLVFKIDGAGNKIWEREFHVKDYKYEINSIVVNQQNEVVFAGLAGDATGADTAYLGDHGVTDVWTGKLDKDGNLLWQNHFGGSKNDFAERINSTHDGGYLIAAGVRSDDGNVTDYVGPDDGWVLKIDNNGKLIWQKVIGSKYIDYVKTVTELPNGNVIVAGSLTAGWNVPGEDIQGPSDVLLAKIGQANYVIGKVYIDYNNNQVFDANDVLFNKGVVSFTRDSLRTSATVTNGAYAVLLGTGSYRAKLSLADSALYTISPANAILTFNELLMTDTLDFALVPKSTAKDLRVDLLPIGRARAGFETQYQLRYENNSPYPINNVELKMVPDHRSSFVSASLALSANRGDTLVWAFSQLAPFQSGTIEVNIKVQPPPALMPGDSLRVRAEIYPISGDLKPLDNITAFNQFVGVSYDPNDKTEVQQGSNFNTRNVSDGDYLKYLIRFQNTGNDTAFTVYVHDTLSDKVDWNTLEMIGTSHTYSLHILDGNKLEWRFNNIKLVDSFTNEPGSHGFIAYRIKPKNNLLAGDTVKNSASIYFDFNPPILTNEAHSVVMALTALPADLMRLDAQWAATGAAQISWTVEQEIDVAYYLVQRSADGQPFETIGKVAASNIWWRHDYTYTDKAPFGDKIYYRIVRVDLNLSQEFSKAALLRRAAGTNGQMQLYPNPAINSVTLTMQTTAAGIATVSIVDGKGSVVQTNSLGNLRAGWHSRAINVSTLPAGQYYLQCRVGDQVFSSKLIKQ